MTILVCAATRPELAACARGIEAAQLGADAFELLLIGVGAANAGPALRTRLDARPRPTLIVSSGFAGALTDGLSVGDWLTARTLAEWSEGPGVLVARSELAAVAAPSPAIACTLVSANTLAASGSALAEKAKASADVVGVDMESLALAIESSRAGIPFMALRLVSDTPANPLPGFLAPFTAAMTSGASLRARLKSAAQGVRQAASDPRGVARVVKEGSEWTRTLSAGWTSFARQLIA